MQKVEIDMQMRGYVISDDIVDVEYIEISDAPEASGSDSRKPSYDMKARAGEAGAFAEKTVNELGIKNDALFELMVEALIMFGIEWSDKNPESAFRSPSARSNAFYTEMVKKQKDVDEKAGKSHPQIFPWVLMTASMGLKWATENPPKYY